MKSQAIFRYDKMIAACLLSFLVAFFCPFFSYAQAEEEQYAKAASFDALRASLAQMQSTGGTIVLTQDIVVPADASYTYNNGRYRKEVTIETNGHTIFVEGYLTLWPFLTIRGDGSQQTLFHVKPGGDLRLVSICLDAGENGTAIVQDEGAFLMYSSEESMGLPAFSCTGEIISAKTTTAAAYWRYDCEKLPIVRVPDGTDFTADMLPDQVLASVNRDYQEYEEEIPVIWDETTFPTEHERTLIQGRFTDAYAQYGDYFPQCLVVWESDTEPFFLNVYLESVTQSYDMVFMYTQSPVSGTLANYYRGKVKTAVDVPIDDLVELLPSDDDTAGDIIEKENTDRLHKEIAYLSKLQRRIVIAYYFENKRQEAIASELDIPLGTVKWHLFEAKKDLKKGMNTMRQTGELKFNPN